MKEQNPPFTIIFSRAAGAQLENRTKEDRAEIDAFMIGIAKDPQDPTLGGIHESREIKDKDVGRFQQLVGKPLSAVKYFAPA